MMALSMRLVTGGSSYQVMLPSFMPDGSLLAQRRQWSSWTSTPGQLSQLPLQGVDLAPGLCSRRSCTAGVFTITANRSLLAGKLLDHEAVVLVVARIRTQFRRTGIEVTDFQVQADHKAGYRRESRLMAMHRLAQRR